VVVGALERPGSGASATTRASLAGVSPQLHKAIAGLSKAPEGNKPVTLGIGEPFTTTIGIALIFAFILALPVILYELYSFLLPAFSPEQKRIATPLMLAIPFLFIAGVTFGYFVVLPAAVRFFQNFNSSEFNVLVQANQYYHFAAVTLLAMGLVFQVPVAILAVTRAGIITPHQLRHNRRYAILACGAIAAFLPGDAITLLLETVPLYLLFEMSLLLATLLDHRSQRAT
jgi:sec-independent protein translocase protein TatC